MDDNNKLSNTRNYAYIRVSTQEQNEDRQMDALKALGVEINSREIYIDHMSGSNFDRPYYQAMKRSIRPGDALYIKSLDRFGRNKTEIKDEWKGFIDQGIDIVVIDTPLISTTNYKNMGSMGKFVSDLILEILSWLAEEELALIKERQREGMESARSRGVIFGRPKIEIDTKFISAYKRWKVHGISAVQAMHECGMTRSTFYRRVAEYEEDLGIREERLDVEVLSLIEDLRAGRITKEDLKLMLDESEY